MTTPINKLTDKQFGEVCRRKLDYRCPLLSEIEQVELYNRFAKLTQQPSAKPRRRRCDKCNGEGGKCRKCKGKGYVPDESR